MADEVMATETVAKPEPTPATVQVTDQVASPEVELWEDGKPFDPTKAKDLIEKLRKENKELKPKAKKADELELAEQKRKEAEMSDLEKAQKRIADLEAQNKAADLRELRRKVGEAHKLPSDVYELLPDLSEAEMEVKAAAIAKALPPSLPQLHTNNPSGTGNTITDAQKRAFLNGGPLPQ